ncbi:conserved hypothetical protein [Vibrio crassostreae]|nr:conserved hypothetical protein [Vibrio crassostreae]
MKRVLSLCVFLAPTLSFSGETYDCNYFVQHKSIPDYVGEYGYLYSGLFDRPNHEQQFPLKREDWYVPHYEQVGPTTWSQSGKSLLHKSRVKVVKQHLGYHFHVKGLLEVIVYNVDGSTKREVINYDNFTPIKYWDCPVALAVRFSPIIAKLKVETIPLDKNGRWMKSVLTKDNLLCTESGHDYRYPNLKSLNNPVKCWIQSQKRNGYFESTNLKVIY